jgi:hypothetical protein
VAVTSPLGWVLASSLGLWTTRHERDAVPEISLRLAPGEVLGQPVAVYAVRPVPPAQAAPAWRKASAALGGAHLGRWARTVVSATCYLSSRLKVIDNGASLSPANSRRSE